MSAPEICPLDSCRICTGCFHSRHNECVGEVRCPTTGDVNLCRCCGSSRQKAT